jgi:SSS family solute:Na+ symporter
MTILAGFGTVNWIVLGVYLAAMVAIGAALAGKQKTTDDYFLAGRQMPWLAVGMSMFASLTSAMTYMAVPGFAYDNNVGIFFGVMVSPLVAPVLIYVFYPFYRRMKVTTSYEYILVRYGKGARYTVGGLFILARMGWLATVIYAPAKALSVVAAMDIRVAVCLMGSLAVAYTVLGGLSAVIWTDVVQFIILAGGAVWMAADLAFKVPGGVAGIFDAAGSMGRLDVFNWGVDLGNMTAVSAMIAWFLFFMNDYGTDQVTVQRLLAVPTYRGMVKAIIFNAVNDVLINGLLLFIGIGMLVYFAAHPDGKPALDGESMMPYYIMHAMPIGISGLMVTAIFAAAMSSMDSGINSLATVMISDFVRPIRRKVRSEKHDVNLARWLTLIIGVLATVVALYAANLLSIIEMWATVMGLFGAPILAIFVMGMMTRRMSFHGWLVGAAAGVGLTAYLMSLGKEVAWVYRFPFSFAATCLVGYVVSLLLSAKPAGVELTVWGKNPPIRPDEY